MSLSIDDLMLVHITNVRPTLQDGKLIMKTGGSTATLKYQDNKIFAGPRDFSCPHRVTLHWSINGVTRTAGIQNERGNFYGISARYAIIEPIAELKDELWGGSFDDMYSLGDHTLSENSLLFVPEEEPDTEGLRTLTTMVFYKGYVDGFTNNHMRGVIAHILEMLKNPRMILNGLFLDDNILSSIWKITLPSRWKILTDDELINDEEFITFNHEKMGNIVSGIIRVNDMRIFVCKEFVNLKLPAGALLIGDGLILIREEELEKVFKDANYVLPEFGVLHPNSYLGSYEKRFTLSYIKDMLTTNVNEVRKYITEKKPATASLNGLSQILERIRSRL